MRIQTIATLILSAIVLAGCGGNLADNGTDETNGLPSMTSTDAPIAVVETPVVLKTQPANSSADGWGTFKGKIKVTGKFPEPVAENVKPGDADFEICAVDGKAPKDDNVVIGKDGQLRDVFVMMYRGKDKTAVPVHPSYEKLKNEPVVLDNKNCRFHPHAVFVRTGQKLRLKNSDSVGHNCHIKTFNNERNDNIPANDKLDVILESVDKSPGPVVCDVHKWMDAVLLVRDEPYVAISKADGTFEIKNVPDGKWKFQFWHKGCANMKKLNVEGYKVGRRGEIEVEIVDGKVLDLGEMSITAEDLTSKLRR